MAGEGAEGEELPSEVDSEGDSLDLESLLSQVRPQGGSYWCGGKGRGRMAWIPGLRGAC